MSKLLLVYLLAILSVTLTSNAATYMVGDNSGWDISTNLDTWTQDKVFKVGDVLMFIYSSSHSVSEVTRENFDNCNMNNAVNIYSNGNTTVTLSKPGDRFFLCGNKLHCFGGMKLQVHVEEDQASSPIASPQAQPSSKSNNPSATFPTSSAWFSYRGSDSLAVAFLGFMACLLWMVQV